MKSISIKFNKIPNVFLELSLLLFLSSHFVNSDLIMYFEILFYLSGLVYFIFNRFKITHYTLWTISLFVYIFITGLNAFDTAQTFIEIRDFLRIALIGNIVIAYIDEEKQYYKILNIFIYSSVFLVFYMFREIPIEQWSQTRLGSAEYGLNSNTVGLTLSYAAVLSFFIAKRKSKIVNYLLVPFFIWLIFLTGSRKAFFLVIAGIGGFLYIDTDNISQKVNRMIMILILTLFAYYLVMNNPTLYELTGSRIQSLIDSVFSNQVGDVSTQQRDSMIEIGIQLYKENPILGYGVGSYSAISGHNTYSHNNYIELAVSTGLIGVLMYYSFYLLLMISMIRNLKETIIKPWIVILPLLMILEVGLVSYNSVLHQFIIALSFCSLKLSKKVKD